MKKYFSILICIAVILSIYSVSFAGGTGTSGAAFLKIGVGGRNIGLGETGSVCGDVNSIYWNPAGLANLSMKEVSLMHSVWLETVNYEHIAFGWPIKAGTFGGAINYLSMGSMDKYDNAGTKINETFTATDMAITVSYAKTFKGSIMAVGTGINLKYISSRIEQESATGFAADLGAQTSLMKDKLKLGLAIQNIGTSMKFVTESDPLPMNIKLGSSYSIPVGENPLELYLDINLPNDNDARLNFGTEYGCKFGKDIKLSPRIGYRSNSKGLEGLTGITAGVGFLLKTYGIDYAFAPYGQLGDTHRISILISF